MKRDYIAEKENSTKSTKEGIVILGIFILLFLVIIIRVALRSGLNGGLFSSLPSDNDAFEISKNYIKPTFRMNNVQFSEDDFQCSKKADSIYEIRSYFETQLANASKVKTNYVMTLKYNGGSNLNNKNWAVLNLQEH